MEVTVTSSRDQGGVFAARQESSTGQFFELRQPAGMVEVRMAVQQNLYVLQLETELLDIGGDHRRRVNEPAIDDEMTFGRCNQVGGDVAGSHIIDVADDSDRLDWFVPCLDRFRVLAR